MPKSRSRAFSEYGNCFQAQFLRRHNVEGSPSDQPNRKAEREARLFQKVGLLNYRKAASESGGRSGENRLAKPYEREGVFHAHPHFFVLLIDGGG